MVSGITNHYNISPTPPRVSLEFGDLVITTGFLSLPEQGKKLSTVPCNM